MPRKNRQLALRNAAPGSDGARPTANQDGTSGKPTKPLPSASVSMFIRRISVKISGRRNVVGKWARQRAAWSL
jgi:hypothetical protein